MSPSRDPTRRRSALPRLPTPTSQRARILQKNFCKRDNFVHLHICETVKPGCDIVENAGNSSVKGEAKAEKDGEDDVGEDGGEVDCLPQALHPLDQGQEDDEPGENEAAGQLQADSPNLRESNN